MKRVLILLFILPLISGPIKLLPSPRGIYYGAFPDLGGTEEIVSCARIRKFEKLGGKRIIWVYFSNNWIKGINFPEKEIREIVRCGNIPFVRLMPRSSYMSGPDPVYTLEAIIDGKFDRKLREWAGKARRFGGPLLVEFGVEMNGNWFPWSGYWNGGGKPDGYGDPHYPDGPERFKDAYRHIIDIFRAEGAFNVTWFFHADALSHPNVEWNKIKYYYPGDEYIDWVGLSSYGVIFPEYREDWISFREKFIPAYNQIKKFAPEKPLAILEFGVTEDPRKPGWIREAFRFIKEFPDIKAISWWQERWENEDGSFSDLRINSSMASLAAFRREISSPLFVTVPFFNIFHMK